MPTHRRAAAGITGVEFERAMIAGGTEPAVASELERRIAVIESAERDDDSRRPFTGVELTLYVGVTVAAVVIGAVMVIL
ncbi:hypothetical protein ABXJ56_08900 [Microbacterium chocolatum]|uniref:hypothetical protein n=1 Tax=Microbacterium aurantiacum TaxID=162393 RepID=UPI00338EC04A